jgi:hypothetical protein
VNWEDSRALCGGRSCPGDDNKNDDGKGGKDTQRRVRPRMPALGSVRICMVIN